MKPRIILMQSSYTAVGTCASPTFACGRHAMIVPSSVVFGVARDDVDSGSRANTKIRRRVMSPCLMWKGQ